MALATRSGDLWDELTYAELDVRSAQTRSWLQDAGVHPGDRVALLGDASGEWVAALFGILRAGAVAVPLDVALTPEELRSLASRAPVSAVLVSRRLAPAIDALLEAAQKPLPRLVLEAITQYDPNAGSDVGRPMDETALLVWTSGTTGQSKGVCLTFANLDYVVTQSVAEQGATHDDNWLSVLSLNHMLELSCGLLACLRTGANMSFPRSPMPDEIVAAMAERRVTRMMAVPMLLRLLYRSLARRPEVGERLRALFSGGAPLSAELLEAYAGLQIPVFQGYGLTELAPAVSMNSARANRPSSVGRPLPGTQVRISDAGEILVRSPGLMTGYWADADATSAVVDRDGWFHTGDLGEIDADGFLYVTGRAKNLIVLESGKKVSPEEVEAAFSGSPMFAEVCVVGLPAAGSGAEEVCAVIVPSADHSADAIEAEVRRCAQVLSGYKRPTVIHVERTPLPKTVKLSMRRRDVLALVQR